MPEPKDIEARLKEVETTAASFQAIIPELRQFMHDEYENSEKMAAAVAGMTKERIPDVTARAVAFSALFGVLAIGVMLYLRPGVISQTQEMSVDTPATADLLQDERMRLREGLPLREDVNDDSSRMPSPVEQDR